MYQMATRSKPCTRWELEIIVFSSLRGPFNESFYQCVTFGAYDSPWQSQMYAIASLMLMFVLPLAVIGTAYGLIFTTISRKSREHSGWLKMYSG
ncbi:hypothetical protein Btru_043687 [Bulinus truncatus]|nr:hypothetical protein Btru_043687 [Bulinus truncatus]